MANLKITIDRGPAGLGAETGRIHVGSSTRLIILRRVLRLSCPNPHLEAPRNCSLPEAVPLGAIGNTTGRMACCKNRMFVEGQSPSTHIRSRFPLHPSLSAMDGASIEGKVNFWRAGADCRIGASK